MFRTCLVAQSLGLRNPEQRRFDKRASLCRRMVQIAMQRGVIVVPVGAFGAINLECAQVRDELREMLRTLALHGALGHRQIGKLLLIEAPGCDR